MRRILPVLFACFAFTAEMTVADSHAAFDPGSEAAVLEIQEKLLGLGFDPGTPDGKMGRNTRNAIREFEASRGFEATGEVSVDLRDRIDQAIAQEARRQAIAGAVAAYDSGNLDQLAEALGDPASLAAFAKDPVARKALRKATANNRHDLVDLLLPFNLADTANTGLPPLIHIAVDKGDAAMLRKIAAAVSDLEVVNIKDQPPLIRALWEEKREAALTLIAAGADPNNTKYRGIAPLHLAAWSGYEDIAEALIAAGADLELKDGIRGFTPIEVALLQGKMGVAKQLLDAGSVPATDSPALKADVSVVGMFGNSGMVEFAQEVVITSIEASEEGFDRMSLRLIAAQDKAYKVRFAEPPQANNSGIVINPGSMGQIGGDLTQKMDIILGEAGNYLPLEGEVQRLTRDGAPLETKIAGVFIGPDTVFRGSHVVGQGDVHPPSSAETLAGFDLTAAGIDGPVTLYLIDDNLKLMPVE